MTILIVVVVSALVVYGFIYFGNFRSAIQSGLKVDLPTSSAEKPQALSQELLLALSSLKDLKLDGKLFKDKAFLSLTDYTEDLKDESLGRDNPFLPVGVESQNLFESSVLDETSQALPLSIPTRLVPRISPVKAQR